MFEDIKTHKVGNVFVVDTKDVDGYKWCRANPGKPAILTVLEPYKRDLIAYVESSRLEQDLREYRKTIHYGNVFCTNKKESLLNVSNDRW